MKLNKYTQLLAATAFFALSASSQASLVYTQVVQDTGSGIGQVNTLLTLENDNQPVIRGNPNPNYGMSSGAVFRTDSGDGTSGNVQSNGNSQVHNATWSFGELNVTQASQLVIIFNPVEPGNVADNSVRLESLVLSIFTDDGDLLWDSGAFAPITFPTSETGTGRSGYAFSLDTQQAALAQPFLSELNRIGLSASLSSANGGPDTFFVRVLDDGEGPGNEIPEPGSVALLGLGIAGMTALRRRKRKA
jgi:hypothetical protein